MLLEIKKQYISFYCVAFDDVYCKSVVKSSSALDVLPALSSHFKMKISDIMNLTDTYNIHCTCVYLSQNHDKCSFNPLILLIRHNSNVPVENTLNLIE